MTDTWKEGERTEGAKRERGLIFCLFSCYKPKGEKIMRQILIMCTVFLLSFISTVTAEELQVHEDYVPRYGNYYKPQDSIFQQYEDYTPRFGNYLKEENGKLQEHEDYVPSYGDYYRKNGSRWQRYEDYVPVYGDYLDE